MPASCSQPSATCAGRGLKGEVPDRGSDAGRHTGGAEGLRADTGPVIATAGASDRQELDLATTGATVGAGAPFITDADTAPLPPLDAPQTGAAQEAVAAAPTAAAGLSDEDVDRIARRLLELAHGTIEQVAWEVIPDVAEVLVRERIRQLDGRLRNGELARPHGQARRPVHAMTSSGRCPFPAAISGVRPATPAKGARSG